MAVHNRIDPSVSVEIVFTAHLVLFFVARCHLFLLLLFASFVIDKSVK